jgi:hypothetical protein
MAVEGNIVPSLNVASLVNTFGIIPVLDQLACSTLTPGQELISEDPICFSTLGFHHIPFGLQVCECLEDDQQYAKAYGQLR